jgi:hypothetical protein
VVVLTVALGIEVAIVVLTEVNIICHIVLMLLMVTECSIDSYIGSGLAIRKQRLEALAKVKVLIAIFAIHDREWVVVITILTIL